MSGTQSPHRNFRSVPRSERREELLQRFSDGISSGQLPPTRWSITSFAKVAGVSRNALYHYFASTEEIVAGVRRYELRQELTYPDLRRLRIVDIETNVDEWLQWLLEHRSLVTAVIHDALESKEGFALLDQIQNGVTFSLVNDVLQIEDDREILVVRARVAGVTEMLRAWLVDFSAVEDAVRYALADSAAALTTSMAGPSSN